jgi:hypothetical protein
MSKCSTKFSKNFASRIYRLFQSANQRGMEVEKVEKETTGSKVVIISQQNSQSNANFLKF